MSRHSRLYEFTSCALCREAPCPQLFANIPNLPLVLSIALFQSLSKIHDHSWKFKTKTDLQIDGFVVLESSCCLTAERQSSRRISFVFCQSVQPYPLFPPSVTLECLPRILELLDLLQCTATYRQRLKRITLACANTFGHNSPAD